MPLIPIPKKIESMNKSEKYIFNKLKRLYMEESSISYLYLEPKIKNLTPDFILIDPIRGVLIIEVKAWGLDYIDTINEKEVKTIDGNTLENPAYKARRYFNKMQGLLYFYDELVDKGKLNFKLHSIVTMTELTKQETIDKSIDNFFDHYPARVVYKNELSNLELSSLFNNDIKVIDSSIIDTIRVAIFPEIKIIHRASNNTSLSELDKKISALDFEQERFIKSLSLGHYMITGIPGSGKTVALLSRALYLARLHKDWKILIVTYNKSLKSQLKLRIDTIKEELDYIDVSLDNIEVTNFHQLAMRYSSLSPRDFNDRSDEFWRDILPNDAIAHVTPEYNAILIDEYQDFYKNWFQLILKLMIKYKEEDKEYLNLFLAGDRLQSIYNPREINWKKDIGLDMRGRAKLLKTSYRITKEHIELGLLLLQNDAKYKKEVEEFYEQGKDIFLKNMTEDSIEIIQSNYKNLSTIIENLLEKYNYNDILLLAPTWSSINNIKVLLPYEIQKNIISSKDINENKMIFSTYHSSKGIEAKVALVVDIDKVQERKLIYVALTRASHKVILHSQNFDRSYISKEIYNLIDDRNLAIS
ncbi:MAG: hypothetical protein DSZ07_02490 [Sulfurovum sp.]|nr:MAG: hypothetical protein DSZ07_02490 [Sulfurovum sp.]